MIGWEYPPSITGGLGVASHGIARGLASLGHEILFTLPGLKGDEPVDPGIRLLAMNSDNLPLRQEEIDRLLAKLPHNEMHGVYETNILEKERAEEIASLKTLPELKKAASALSGGYGNDLYTQIEVYAQFVSLLASRLDIDLIHAHDWITYPAGLGALQLTRKPLVVHVHATEYDRSGENGNIFVRDLERHTYGRANAIITVSNYTKSILVDKYGANPEKIYPVHNAIEMQHAPIFHGEAEKPFKEKMVLFLGRITFQKGPDYFVRAARKVIDVNPNVRFVMVGTGDMYTRMIEMAADMGLGRFFHYTGFLNREQIRNVFAMSDLYVIPSVSEPFGITVLEAMQYGVPVIVSKQSGVSEIIQHCIKVDFWDVDALADSILHLVDNEEEHNRLREGGKGEVTGITWTENARKIEEVYGRLLS